jgi:RNA polymerase sigma-70 factor (ECF subfamily)
MGARAAVSAGTEEGTDDVVRRARSGDFGAFEDLYHRYLRGIYALCVRMTANPSRAEELTQETFVRAWRKLDQFRGEGGFGAWLRRLALNLVLSERRSAARRGHLEIAADNVVAFPGAPARDHGSAIDLEQAIAVLPAGARRVFVLHDVEGYRHEEIAHLLGVATGTSKAQLHRARRLLREALRR